MAAMNTFSRVQSGQGLHQLESFNFPSATPLPSIQGSGFYNPETSFHFKSKTIDQPATPTPLTSKLTTLSPKAPTCLLCKGQKYGFTAYFHNSKIFPEPPHDLLPLIEKSYVLNNRFKSIFVTYIMRELEQDGYQEAEKEVLVWCQLVEDLLNEVKTSAAGFELSPKPLEDVWNWTREMTKQIQDSVGGRQKLEMAKGRLQVLLLELRKNWEEVWKAYLVDRKTGPLIQENVSL